MTDARSLPLSALLESRHPYTCGTCTWEGATRNAYFEHAIREHHDHWEAILEAAGNHADAARASTPDTLRAGRARPFVIKVSVSRELMAQDRETADREAWRMVDAHTEFRGPRGGRYVADGPVHHWTSDVDMDDFMHGTVGYFGRRMARYIRPRSQVG